jgi:hypothetical protein
MYIIRSFDTNKPGTLIESLEGGVIGGTIAQGKFSVGEDIEIRPGISADREGKTVYDPLVSEIVSLHAGEKTVKEASAGYLDHLPAAGNESGRAFRDVEWEKKIEKICQDYGVGAQFGGKYFVHDVRVIRMPRHAASCPVGMGVSCRPSHPTVAIAPFRPQASTAELGGPRHGRQSI